MTIQVSNVGGGDSPQLGGRRKPLRKDGQHRIPPHESVAERVRRVRKLARLSGREPE